MPIARAGTVSRLFTTGYSIPQTATQSRGKSDRRSCLAISSLAFRNPLLMLSVVCRCAVRPLSL